MPLYKLLTKDARPYCTAVGCHRCSRLEYHHGGYWCPDHGVVISLLRNYISAHRLTLQEKWLRVQEIFFRKWSDEGHTWFASQLLQSGTMCAAKVLWVEVRDFERAMADCPEDTTVLLVNALWFFPRFGLRSLPARDHKRRAVLDKVRVLTSLDANAYARMCQDAILKRKDAEAAQSWHHLLNCTPVESAPSP